jgi:hypothetical protein
MLYPGIEHHDAAAKTNGGTAALHDSERGISRRRLVEAAG